MGCNFIYRELDPETANRVIDACEILCIEYDIWNPEDAFMGNGDCMVEIGIQDWNQIQIPF